MNDRRNVDRRRRGYSRPNRVARRFQCRSEVAPISWRVRVCAIATLMLTLSAAIGYVWLRSDQQRMGKELQVIRREFAVRAKELENLRMEVERYRGGRYILRAVDRLGLRLRPPLPGQVRRIYPSGSNKAQDTVARDMIAARQ